MGNTQIRNPKLIHNDEDYKIMKTLYERFPVKNNQSIQVFQEIDTKHALECDINLDNQLYAEIRQIHTYQNLTNHKTSINFQLNFIYSQKSILLDFKIITQSKTHQSHFKRTTKLIEEDFQHLNIIDISNPNCQIKIDLDPNETVEIYLNFLQRLDVLQNHYVALQMQLPIAKQLMKLSTTFHTNELICLTHKLSQIDEFTYQCLDHTGSQNLILLVSTDHHPQVYINKIPLGDSGYATQEKYCAVISLIPNISQQQEINDFNFLYNINGDYQQDFLRQINDSKIKDELDEVSLISATSKMSRVLSEFRMDANLQFGSCHQFSWNKKQITFFIDQSNSMNSLRIEIVKQTLFYLLRSLPNDTYYNIYLFGSKFKKFYDEHVKVSEDNIKKSIDRLKTLKGDMGSTFLHAALLDSLKENVLNDVQMIWMILTDGYIAEAEKILNTLSQHPQIQVYSVGLGWEFDKEIVEQIAKVGNGGYKFCDRLMDLINSTIQLLHISLTPRLINVSLENADQSYITLMYPDPNKVYKTIDQQLMFACYYSPEVGNHSDHNVALTYQLNSSSEVTKLEVSLNFKNAKIGGLLHLYVWAEIIDQFLFSLNMNETSLSYLMVKQEWLQLYRFQTGCDRYQFLNPFTCMTIDGYVITQNIKLGSLQRLNYEHRVHKSLTQILSQYIFRGSKLEESNIDQIVLKIPELNQLEKIENSGTRNANELLIKIINSQDCDGSFSWKEISSLLNPLTQPSLNLTFNSTMTSNNLSEMYSTYVSNPVSPHNPNDVITSHEVEDKRNIRFPPFIMEKLYATAMVIVFLKNQFGQLRGHWILVFLKARNFLNQYVNNPNDLYVQVHGAFQQSQQSTQQHSQMQQLQSN